MGRSKVMRIFREASQSVPAYRVFLESKNVDPTAFYYEVFESLPLLDKQSYLIPFL